MIYVANIALQRMLTIFSTLSEPNTSSQSTWKQQYTLGLNSRWTMCTKLSHCLFQVMYTKHYNDFSTSWDEAKINLHIPVFPSSMDRRSDMRTLWTQHIISRIKKLSSCNRCAAIFCIIPLPSITLFSLHSAIFPQSNPKPQQTLQSRLLSSWTTSPQIHKHKYNTEQVGCNWPSIQMPPTFWSLNPEDRPEDLVPTTNGILLVMCKIMRKIMASEAEVEYGTIFVNNQPVLPIHTTLSEMGWKQGPTSIQVENSNDVCIATKEFLQKKSKAMDIRFYWINDRIE